MALTRPRAYQIYDIDYKQATRVVTTTNITLAGGAPSTVDGVALAANNRILVTGQTTGSENGIYYVTTLGTGSNGTWERSVDTNATGELLSGTIVMVTEGDVFKDTQWKLTTDDPITIGSTALTFVQNYSANSISAGTSNVVVTSNGAVTISSAGTANVLTVNASSISVAGNIYPTANVTYGLGNTTNRFKDIWLSNSTIYLGNVALSATSTTLLVNGTNVVTETSGAISVSGNVTGGNITTAGQVSATGNVTGNYILGNVAFATGIPATYGNSNVADYLASGTDTSNIITTGNVSGTYILGNVAFATGIPATYGNSNVAAYLESGTDSSNIVTTANVTGGNITTAGQVSSTGNITSSANITGGNVLTGGLISATGNISGGNLVTASQIVSTLANGTAPLVVTSTTKVINLNVEQVDGYHADTANVVSTIAVRDAAANITAANFNGTGVSVSGNVTGSNITTGGAVSATGAGYFGGGLSVIGNITASGNINYTNVNDLVVGDPLIYIGANNTSNLVDEGIVASANVGGLYQHLGFVRDHSDGVWKLFGNVVAEPTTVVDWANAVYQGFLAGSVSTTGNITGTGNVAGGNILTGGIVSATGNVSGNYFLGNGRYLTGITGGGGGGGTVYFQDTAPSTPSSGDVWIVGNTAVQLIYFDDGTSSQWAEMEAFETYGSATVTNVPGGSLYQLQYNNGAGSFSGSANLTFNGSVLSVVGTVQATGNITGGNLNATGLSLSGNVVSAINSTANITTTANIAGGNLNATGLSLSGNVVSAINSTANITTTGNISGGNIIGNYSGNVSFGTGFVSGTGNVTAGNVNITGLVSATGNIIAGTDLYVGAGATTAGFTTAPIIVGRDTGGTYVQVAIQNASGNGSADYTAYASNGTESAAWADIGMTGNTFNDTNYTVTGPNDGYFFVQGNASYGGNLVIATGNIGTTKDIIFATGGFQSSNIKARLYNSTGVFSVTGNIAGGNLSVSTGTVTLGGIINANANGIGNIGSTTSFFNTVFAQATSAQYADLAENYEADAEYEPGTVLMFGGDKEITLAEENTTAIAGVVSTNPAHLMNSGCPGISLPIALQGRVPCKVTGQIRKGDLMIAGANGYAKSTTTPQIGQVIGKALQNHNGDTGVIEIAVGRL